MTQLLEKGTLYTSDNGFTHDLGVLSDTHLHQYIDEKVNTLRQMTDQYNRHGWAGGSAVYQQERAGHYRALEALRTEAARRLSKEVGKELERIPEEVKAGRCLVRFVA